MDKVFLILKNYLKTYMGSFARRTKKGAYITGIAVLMLSGVSFIFLFSSISLATIEESLKLDPPEPTLVLQSIAGMSLMFFIFTTLLKGSNIRPNRDDSLLISLPFKKWQIVMARALKDWIFDFFTMLLVVMPGIICYYLRIDNATILSVLFGVLVALLLSFLASAVSYFLSLLIKIITSRFRQAKILQTIINVIFVLIFLVLYYSFTLSINHVETGMINKLMNFYPVRLIYNILAFNDLLSLIILILTCLIPFILSIIVMSLVFNKQGRVVKAKDNTLSFKEQSLIKTLYKKEVGRYFSSSLVVLNTSIGGAFLIILAMIMLALGTGFIENIVNTFATLSLTLDYKIIVSILCIFVGSTICTTTSSISLEGNKFWIIKSLPIGAKKVYISKILLNITVAAIPEAIAGIIFGFALSSFYYGLMCFVLSFLASLLASLLGLLLNLKYYRFDWDSEQEVVKQGMAVLLGLAFAFVPGGISIIAYAILTGTIGVNGIFLVGVAVAMIVVILILARILFTKGVKKFASIS